jgi:hypothetical protein
LRRQHGWLNGERNEIEMETKSAEVKQNEEESAESAEEKQNEIE